MSGAFSLATLRSKFLGRDECRIIIVGLNGSGKTTIVYRLKHGKLHDSQITPTIGFNLECVEYRKMIFSLWDLGGSPDARSFWRMYYVNTQAIIFVVDSSDVARMVRRFSFCISPTRRYAPVIRRSCVCSC